MFSRPHRRVRAPADRPACPRPSAPTGCARPAFNAPTPRRPNSCHPGLFPARSAPENPPRRGQTRPRSAAFVWPGGVLFVRTLWGSAGGTQTPLAPNGPEARTLHRARQELVRVPESNTKCGGLRGITGGKPAPVVDPSISESSGIPNRKNLHPVTLRTLHPAVHRAGIFLGNGIASAGLT